MSETHIYRGRPVEVGDELYAKVSGRSDYKSIDVRVVVTGFTPSGMPRIEVRSQSGETISAGLAEKSGYYRHQRAFCLFILVLVRCCEDGLSLGKTLSYLFIVGASSPVIITLSVLFAKILTGEAV